MWFLVKVTTFYGFESRIKCTLLEWFPGDFRFFELTVHTTTVGIFQYYYLVNPSLSFFYFPTADLCLTSGIIIFTG